MDHTLHVDTTSIIWKWFSLFVRPILLLEIIYLNGVMVLRKLVKIRLDISISLRSSVIGEERRETEISSLI